VEEGSLDQKMGRSHGSYNSTRGEGGKKVSNDLGVGSDDGVHRRGPAWTASRTVVRGGIIYHSRPLPVKQIRWEPDSFTSTGKEVAGQEID